MVNKIYAKKKEFTTQYIMAELSHEKKMIAMEAILESRNRIIVSVLCRICYYELCRI